MRSDTNLNQRFRAEGVDTRDYGSMPGVLDTNTTVEGRGRVLRSHSFSGHETNSVFYNLAGRLFADISGVSGMDSIADGRGFAYFDFDRDGWQDVVLVNSNAPQLELFRNRLGDIAKRLDSDTASPKPANAIHVRLRGGNSSSEPAPGLAPRDGYGAHVLVKVNGMELLRESRCGDGFAVQNSATLHIGIGQATAADALRVVWPSGKITDAGRVEAGTTVSVEEVPAQGQPAFVLSQPAAAASAALETSRAGPPRIDHLDLELPPDGARLRVFTTMATWCAVCRSELPHFAHLKGSLPQDAVALYGLPADPEDTREKLDTYAAKNSPAYHILSSLLPVEQEKISGLFRKHLGDAALPSTMVTNSTGDVLLIKKGTVSVSAVRQLLRKF